MLVCFADFSHLCAELAIEAIEPFQRPRGLPRRSLFWFDSEPSKARIYKQQDQYFYLKDLLICKNFFPTLPFSYGPPRPIHCAANILQISCQWRLQTAPFHFHDAEKYYPPRRCEYLSVHPDWP